MNFTTHNGPTLQVALDDGDMRLMLKEALQLKLAHDIAITFPSLVGDEGDIGDIKQRHDMALEMLTEVGEVASEVNARRWGDAYDNDPLTKEEWSETIQTGRKINNLVKPGEKTVNKSTVRTMRKILEGAEPSDFGLTPVQFYRTRIDLEYAMGNDTTVEALREELEAVQQ